MSFGFNEVKTELGAATPSKITRGFTDPLAVVAPRMVIFTSSFPGCPVERVTIRPGEVPCNPLAKLVSGLSSNTLESMVDTAPVREDFF